METRPTVHVMEQLLSPLRRLHLGTSLSNRTAFMTVKAESSRSLVRIFKFIQTLYQSRGELVYQLVLLHIGNDLYVNQ